MLPWLQRYQEHQKAVILHDVFLHGFQLPSFSGIGCHVFDNLPSIYLHSKIVWKKILKDVQGGGITGPFHAPPFNNVRVWLLGILPKN